MIMKSFIAFICMSSTIFGLKNVEFSSSGKGSFINIIEKGVVVAGKSNIIFSVKACQSAAFVVSDIIGIGNTTGRYFIIMYGTANNKIVMAYDSCFKCSLSKQIKQEVLDCDTYRSFWVRWDKKGNVDTGSGTTVGSDTLLTLDGFYEDYNINNAAVTSTGGAVAHWRFTATETATEFFSPSPGGATKVYINESIAVGSIVLNFSIKPPDDNITYSLGGDGADHFTVANKSLVVSEELDYESESEQFYLLTIGTNIGVSTSMTVIVEDVVDEAPIINTTGLVHIPEELPVGTVVWWNRTVTDLDANDSLTYTLTGPLSELLTLTPSGDFNVTQRIDREALNSSMINSTATLTITDSSGLKVETELNMIITDVNDNPPLFNRTLFEVELMQNATTDVAVVDLGYYDKDEGENGRVNLSIVSEDSSSVYMNQSVLYVKANSLGVAISPSGYKTLVIEASDQPTTGASRTATAVVLIKIPQGDKHELKWTFPAMKSKTVFKDAVVSKSSPPGTLVTVFRLRGQDNGETPAFLMNSLGSEESTFHLDSETGELKTEDVLKKESYTITVTGTLGSRAINGTITVNIKEGSNTETPVLKFSRSTYIIKEPKIKDVGRTLLVVSLLNRGNASRVKLTMDEKGSRAFLLEAIDEKWKFMLREDFYNQSLVSLPTFVILSAYARGTRQTASAYIVVDGQIVQRGPRSTITTTRGHTNATLTTTYTPETTTSTSTTTTSTVMTTTVANVKRKACTPTGPIPVAILWSTIAIQGTILIGLLTYMFAARQKRKKKNSVEPERSEPVGCEPDKKLSEKGGSKSAIGSKEKIDADPTVLEILDETTSHDLKEEEEDGSNAVVGGATSRDKTKDEEIRTENRRQSKNDYGNTEEDKEADVANDDEEDDLIVSDKGTPLKDIKTNPADTTGKGGKDCDTEKTNDSVKVTLDDSNDCKAKTEKELSFDSKTNVENNDVIVDVQNEGETARNDFTCPKGKTEKDSVKDDNGIDNGDTCNVSKEKETQGSNERTEIRQESRKEKDLDSIFDDKNASIDDDDFFGLSQNTQTSEAKSVFKSKQNTPKHVDFFDDFDDSKPDTATHSMARTPFQEQQDFNYTMNKMAEHNNKSRTGSESGHGMSTTERKSQQGYTPLHKQKVEDEYLQRHTLKHTNSPLHPGNTSPASLMTDHDDLLTMPSDNNKYTRKPNTEAKSTLNDTSVYDKTSSRSHKAPKSKDVFGPVTAVGVTTKTKGRAAEESDGSDSAEDSEDSQEEDQEVLTASGPESKASSAALPKPHGKKSSKLDSGALPSACVVEEEPSSKKGKKKKKGRKKKDGEKKNKSKPKKGGSKKSTKKHKRK